MDLGVKDWKYFKFDNLFIIRRGESLFVSDCEEGKTPYASASSVNNGISQHLDINPNRKGLCLQLNYDGSVGDCFFHKDPFFASEKIVTLTLKNYELNEKIAFFLETVIRQEKFKFSYGRKWSVDSKMKNSLIKLHADDGGNPDWLFMEKYIEKLHVPKLTTINKTKHELLMINERWKDFSISSLFSLQVGKAHSEMVIIGDELPYIGAKRANNGVMLHCVKDETLMQSGNCIIFICNGEGSVGYANYMDTDFIGTTDIVAGYNQNLNQYSGLFIATVLCLERPKYSFGRKWKTHLRDTTIKLPSIDNEPDWQYMENYIKSLPFGDRI